jgi:hypothetical protein
VKIRAIRVKIVKLIIRESAAADCVIRVKECYEDYHRAHREGTEYTEEVQATFRSVPEVHREYSTEYYIKI